MLSWTIAQASAIFAFLLSRLVSVSIVPINSSTRASLKPTLFQLPPDANNPIDHATQHSIEDFNNLGVVTWIQDDATKEVIQSTVSTISATNVEELNTTKLMLFPNPAENTATVAFEGLEGSDVKIDLYNLLGELVFTGNHTSASSFDYYNIDVTTLNNGIYNLVLTVGESMTTKKLQILK